MNDRFARAGAIARVDLAHEPDFTLGNIEVCPSLRELAGDGWRETIDRRVMQVLVALARAKGNVVSRDDLIESCWEGVIVGDEAINRCISRLRKAAEASGKAFTIETVSRVGYRLKVAETDSSQAMAAGAETLSDATPGAPVEPSQAPPAIPDAVAVASAISNRPLRTYWPAALGAFLILAVVAGLAARSLFWP